MLSEGPQLDFEDDGSEDEDDGESEDEEQKSEEKLEDVLERLTIDEKTPTLVTTTA
jgi:hypothetical protein